MTQAYLRNRYYDPAIGRFISEDPVKDGLNWYAYCGNNPIMFVDPLGLAQWIRNLVEQTTGEISWSTKNSTATVTIDGVTQDYLVKGGLVYVNDVQAGYIEDGRIMVEEFDFDRDFNIAGMITLYNYYNETQSEYISSYDVGGHSWIGYKTIYGDNITVSTGYQTYTGSSFTASTWNCGETSVLNRKWDQSHINNSYTKSYSKKITKNQENHMLETINSTSISGWSTSRTCTTYANSVFFSATGIPLGDFYIVQPKSMAKNIDLRKRYDNNH